MIATAPPTGLSPAGWVLMIGCIGLVCTLGAFCYWRILRTPPSERDNTTLDTDARDTD